jgi:hypothetical protein
MRYVALPRLPRLHAQSNKNNHKEISHVPVIIVVKSTRSPNTSLSFHTATDTNTAPSSIYWPPSIPPSLHPSQQPSPPISTNLIRPSYRIHLLAAPGVTLDHLPVRTTKSRQRRKTNGDLSLPLRSSDLHTSYSHARHTPPATRNRTN